MLLSTKKITCIAVIIQSSFMFTILQVLKHIYDYISMLFQRTLKERQLLTLLTCVEEIKYVSQISLVFCYVCSYFNLYDYNFMHICLVYVPMLCNQYVSWFLFA